MGRALERRLGVPAAAYTTPDGRLNGLEALLEAAKAPEAGGRVELRHGLTGRAGHRQPGRGAAGLQQGYVPMAWAGRRARSSLADGRIVAVLNDQGLPGGARAGARCSRPRPPTVPWCRPARR